jgi:hypothetical protein
MTFAEKAEFIKTWQHAHLFTPREIEYLSMEVVKLHGFIPLKQQIWENDQLVYTADAERQQAIHTQLDEIWDALDGWTDKEKVIMMTHKSGHPAVQAILIA